MHENIIQLTLSVIHEAGNILEQYFGKKLRHYSKGKGSNDFTTEADLASEKLIINRIQEYFPNDDIISEESKPLASSHTKNTWIIDPLDGTYNFTHGIQNCGVMIAYALGSYIRLAFLYNPFKKITILARRGQGVFINGEKKHLDATNPNLRIVADDKGFAPLLNRHVLANTCLWSSVDNALLVIAGTKNAYFNKTAKVWDLAPLSLCFEEYGLLVMTADQTPYQWQSESQTLIAIPPEKIMQIKHLLA